MPIRHAIWQVGAQPMPLEEGSLASEKLLEDMIEGEVPILDVAKGAHYHIQFVDDPERCEWFVPVRWLQTLSLERAVREVGMFGNQNTVCKPTTPKWRSTVERLKERFPDFDKV